MRYLADGIAWTPKFCCSCGYYFWLERYKKVFKEISPSVSGYNYYCHKCYVEKFDTDALEDD